MLTGNGIELTEGMMLILQHPCCMESFPSEVVIPFYNPLLWPLAARRHSECRHLDANLMAMPLGRTV